LDHVAQVAVGGAQDAHVGPEGLRFPYAANFARFQEAEQLDLDVLVELTDFIEEERAAVGYLEQALVIALGAGKRSPPVAEKLALHQVFPTGAPQLTGMKGISARLLCWNRVRAASSLPVPVSPRIITVDSVGATVAISRCTAFMADELHTRMVGPSAAWTRLCRASALCLRSRFSLTLARTVSISVSLHGLVT